MTNEWIPVMTDGKKSGQYKWTSYWFNYQNKMNQTVLLEIFDEQNRKRVRHHILENERFEIHRLQLMNFESITIKVITMFGKEIFNYKSKR